MAKLLAGLRRSVVGGAVPEAAFLAQVRALGLGEREQARLRAELKKIGLPVRPIVVHAEDDPPVGRKVAQRSEENVRAAETVAFKDAVVGDLLARYRDAEGYVTARALNGVARLCGLTPRETAELRRAVRVRDGVVAGVAAQSARPERAGTRVSESSAVPAADRVAAAPAVGGVGREVKSDDVIDPAGMAPLLVEPAPVKPVRPGDTLGAAVSAAYAVMDADRFRKNHGKLLLTAEEEVGLAVLVRGGPHLIGQEPDVKDLASLERDHIRVRAQHCLVLHNQGLVHKVAQPYQGQGLEYEDLIQHGMLGLMRAVVKFDPSKGFKFSTYAMWWIRQAITRSIADEGALIRVPVHMHEQIRKVANAERALIGQGRRAGLVDVAVFCDMPVQRVEEIRRLSRRTDSLDRVIRDGVTLGDFVGQEQPAAAPDAQVMSEMFMGEVMDIIDANFSQRDARVLVRRLGLDDDEPSTLDELGKEFGVTRERIRQVESKAMSKFRGLLADAGVVSRYRVERRGSAGEGAPNTLSARTVLMGDGGADAVDEGVSVVREAEDQGTAEPVEEGGVMAPTASVLMEKSDPVPVTAAPTTESGFSATVTTPASPATMTSAEIGRVAEAGNGALSGAAPVSVLPMGQVQSDRQTKAGPARPTEGAEVSGPAADWDRAQQLAVALSGTVQGRAEYVLLALGATELTAVLGPDAAEAVRRAAYERGTLNRQVVKALEVLRYAFDVVRKAGLRPEDFLDRPAVSLAGRTPRECLATRPLTLDEMNLAVRKAVWEFPVPATRAAGGVRKKAARAPERGDKFSAPAAAGPVGRAKPAPCETERPAAPAAQSPAATGMAPVPTPPQLPEGAGESTALETPPGPAEKAPVEPGTRCEAGLSFVLARDQYAAQLAALRDRHIRQVLAERDASQARLAAARDAADNELDALEDVLLQRTDRALLRQRQQMNAAVRGEAVLNRAALARLTIRVEQAERAELVAQDHAREAASRASSAAVREGMAEQHRHAAEVRLAELEGRLQQAEALLAERDAYYRAVLQEAMARVDAAEQQAADGVAQAERDASARISELEFQLAAEREAQPGRTSIRDRWRRS
ncbi:sigma-70 family RNA polymerase sigma factor [Streptomyces longisporoflavus]|uniref:Sigma-70 family RNA polymerase sigma factor n=1 Tax=Streptomyces longisporoflavus TaxID=28044 RepID=A0ABW7QFH8_9ACTN